MTILDNLRSYLGTKPTTGFIIGGKEIATLGSADTDHLNEILHDVAADKYLPIKYKMTADARGYEFYSDASLSGNLYEGGKADERVDTALTETSRFRPRYRKLNDEEIALHDQIKTAASTIESLFEQTPKSREQSIAFTKLEEAVMWAVKGLTK